MSSSLDLPASPESVGLARRHVLMWLEARQLESLIDAVLLLVSECTTNALVHTGGASRLQIAEEGDGVRVSVFDSSPVLPRRRAYSDTSTTGRGWQLLEDLSDTWGVEPDGSGKVVWFTARPGRDPWAAFDAASLLGQADL